MTTGLPLLRPVIDSLPLADQKIAKEHTTAPKPEETQAQAAGVAKKPAKQDSTALLTYVKQLVDALLFGLMVVTRLAWLQDNQHSRQRDSIPWRQQEGILHWSELTY